MDKNKVLLDFSLSTSAAPSPPPLPLSFSETAQGACDLCPLGRPHLGTVGKEVTKI